MSRLFMREREASTAHMSDRVHGSEHPDRKEGAADCVFSDRFIFEQPSLWRFFLTANSFRNSKAIRRTMSQGGLPSWFLRSSCSTVTKPEDRKGNGCGSSCAVPHEKLASRLLF